MKDFFFLALVVLVLAGILLVWLLLDVFFLKQIDLTNHMLARWPFLSMLSYCSSTALYDTT